MTAITQEEALNLYNILDEHIGVFRENEMPESAKKFYMKKRQAFFDIFTTEIPEEYWFQGAVCRSANLILNNGKFIVVPEILSDDAVAGVIERTNNILSSLSFS